MELLYHKESDTPDNLLVQVGNSFRLFLSYLWGKNKI